MAVYLKLFCMALFWGGTFIAGRLLAGDVAPLSAAFLRYVIASALLLLFTLKTHGRLPRPTGRQMAALLVLGLTGVVSYNLFFFKGLALVPAGRASLIIANNPIFITLCAAIFFREPLSTRKLAGVLVSVCGAVLAISKGDPASLFEGGVGRGDGFMFCCVLSWVTYTLVGKAVLAKLSPLVTVTYSALIGTLGLGLPVMASGRLAQLGQYSLVNWLSMAYLGIFGTVIGFIWYYEGIQAIGAAKSSLFINVVPLSAIVMAYLFLGEPMTFSLVSGTLLVVAGVYLTTAPGKQAGLSATMAIRGGPS